MTNYTAEDINNWVSNYYDQFQFLVVAHTNCYPKDKSLQTIFSQQIKRSEFLGKTLFEVSKSLYKNEPFLPRDYRDEYGLAHKVEGTWDVLNTWLPSSKLLAQK